MHKTTQTIQLPGLNALKSLFSLHFTTIGWPGSFHTFLLVTEGERNVVLHTILTVGFHPVNYQKAVDISLQDYRSSQYICLDV